MLRCGICWTPVLVNDVAVIPCEGCMQARWGVGFDKGYAVGFKCGEHKGFVHGLENIQSSVANSPGKSDDSVQ